MNIEVQPNLPANPQSSELPEVAVAESQTAREELRQTIDPLYRDMAEDAREAHAANTNLDPYVANVYALAEADLIEHSLDVMILSDWMVHPAITADTYHEILRDLDEEQIVALAAVLIDKGIENSSVTRAVNYLVTNMNRRYELYIEQADSGSTPAERAKLENFKAFFEAIVEIDLELDEEEGSGDVVGSHTQTYYSQIVADLTRRIEEL